MLIRVEQTNRFSSGLHVGHPFGFYFLQNDVQLRYPHFLTEGAFESSPTFEWHYSWMFH